MMLYLDFQSVGAIDLLTLTARVLQVSWPKLNTPRFAVEGYQEALAKARKDPLVGGLISGRERGASTARLNHLEEGKKRIQ